MGGILRRVEFAPGAYAIGASASRRQRPRTVNRNKSSLEIEEGHYLMRQQVKRRADCQVGVQMSSLGAVAIGSSSRHKATNPRIAMIHFISKI